MAALVIRVASEWRRTAGKFLPQEDRFSSKPATYDCLVRDAVPSEPVSRLNSLVAGKSAGELPQISWCDSGQIGRNLRFWTLAAADEQGIFSAAAGNGSTRCREFR